MIVYGLLWAKCARNWTFERRCIAKEFRSTADRGAKQGTFIRLIPKISDKSNIRAKG
jgi:hypothetical protein